LVIVSLATAEETCGVRFYFPDHGLLELIHAVDRSTRSRSGYVIPAYLGEHIQVGIGLSGWWGQHRRATLAREAMPKFVRTLEFGAGNAASGQLGL
jgi:hypothetical protein